MMSELSAAARRARASYRPTLRARLTMLYGGLFLAAGAVLLLVTWALLEQRIPEATLLANVTSNEPNNAITVGNGEVITTTDLPDWIAEQQEKVRSAALNSLLTQGAIALGLVGAVAAGFGWLIAGRVLAPLHRVTDTARRIANAPATDRSLHERIAMERPADEVKELADTFDTMLDRLDRSFDGQRRFVANASHELRTPLTVSRALVELAMRRRAASADVAQLGDALLDINDQQEHLIGGLLLLARSQNEIPERSPVDLARVVEHVAQRSADEAADATVRIHVTAEPAPTSGDPVLLERLVQNLIENGIRHNLLASGWVHVVTRSHHRGAVELAVSNTGPVVPEYEIAGLFEPFHRLDRNRPTTVRGAGLGLSIVRAIARAHGGDVTAHAREDGGLTVRVTLPGG